MLTNFGKKALGYFGGSRLVEEVSQTNPAEVDLTLPDNLGRAKAENEKQDQLQEQFVDLKLQEQSAAQPHEKFFYEIFEDDEEFFYETFVENEEAAKKLSGVGLSLLDEQIASRFDIIEQIEFKDDKARQLALTWKARSQQIYESSEAMKEQIQGSINNFYKLVPNVIGTNQLLLSDSIIIKKAKYYIGIIDQILSLINFQLDHFALMKSSGDSLSEQSNLLLPQEDAASCIAPDIDITYSSLTFGQSSASAKAIIGGIVLGATVATGGLLGVGNLPIYSKRYK